MSYLTLSIGIFASETSLKNHSLLALYFLTDKITLKQKTPMSSLGAYVFGNVFYYLYWNNDTSIVNKYWNDSSAYKIVSNDSIH